MHVLTTLQRLCIRLHNFHGRQFIVFMQQCCSKLSAVVDIGVIPLHISKLACYTDTPMSRDRWTRQFRDRMLRSSFARHSKPGSVLSPKIIMARSEMNGNGCNIFARNVGSKSKRWSDIRRIPECPFASSSSNTSTSQTTRGSLVSWLGTAITRDPVQFSDKQDDSNLHCTSSSFPVSSSSIKSSVSFPVSDSDACEHGQDTAITRDPVNSGDQRDDSYLNCTSFVLPVSSSSVESNHCVGQICKCFVLLLFKCSFNLFGILHDSI